MKRFGCLKENFLTFENLFFAFKKAYKGTKNYSAYKFAFYADKEIFQLREELMSNEYKPGDYRYFKITDPKERLISVAPFRDRVVHHALVNVLEPIFDKTFIYDSCANRKGKGNLMALQRFDYFRRKVSRNGLVAKNTFKDANYVTGYCLKADIKHQR